MFEPINFSPEPVRLWRSVMPVAYPDAMALMEQTVAEVQEGGIEAIWFLEHPPLYTAGTSAKPEDLVDPDRFPVFSSPRGGQYTYHGPGQRVVYLMLDLKRRRRDVRMFVQEMERWIIDALGDLGVEASVKPGRVGVWVDRAEGREDKIAAIGVRIRKWVTFHGISLNVAPDLGHFGGIVPCGIAEENFGVTSLHDLGHGAGMERADEALQAAFERVFGPLQHEPLPTLLPR
jgi:lipoyl(octanoyl) transferase